MQYLPAPRAITPLPDTATELTAAVHQAADHNPALVYLASLAPGSRRTMRQALNVIAGLLTLNRCTHLDLPWGMLRFQHTQAVRSALQEKYSAPTANKMLSALRQTLHAAWNLGYMSADEYQRAIDLKPVIGEKPDAAFGRALSYGEWAALLNCCAGDQSAAGVRDAAMFALFRIAGLRRAEMASLNVADYNLTNHMLTIRGKRNKTRVIPIEDPGAIGALADWLYLLVKQEMEQETVQPLFTRILKGGKVTATRLTDQAIYYILDVRRQQAGVAPFMPHDTRRTFAGDLLDAGVDLATVQGLMGHANANTTARYDRRGVRARQEAVRKLHVPYQRRFEG